HVIHAWQAGLHANDHVSDLAGVVEHLGLAVQPRHFVVDDGDADRVVAAGNVTVKHGVVSCPVSSLPSIRPQWLIIQGRAVGKPLAPLFVFVISRAGFLPEQQPQPGPCEALYSPDVFGAWRLCSLVAWALRLSDGMHKNFGAVRMTRGDSSSQRGQSCGRSHSAIGRMSVNGPQSLQRYS